MPDIELTKIEFDNSEEESAASFDFKSNDFAVAALRAEPRSHLSALVFVPYGPEGAPQTDVGREARQQLLEHLEEFVQELREILKE